MGRTPQGIPIIKTKLYRPPVAPDIVCRKELHESLDGGLLLPLTLVSAPAGYGKSTLISHWLESSNVKSAWLSLDKDDGDLRTFLLYLVAAVKSVLPKVCRETPPYLEAPELPPVTTLITALSNDFERIRQAFVLVLDDYHLIPIKSQVHELIDTLLKHPAPNARLVIMARRHPPLALARLRARHMLTEFGIREMAFTRTDVDAVLINVVSWKIDDSLLSRIHEASEGWPVAIRMAGIALNRLDGPSDDLLKNFEGDSYELQEYLLEEVLASLSPEVQDCLVRISVLDRFCKPLCHALCGSRCARGECMYDYGGLLPSRETAGLLRIDLDPRGEWSRYHHLVKQLLRRQIESHLDVEAISELHLRASAMALVYTCIYRRESD